jgi:prepilin-type N-terminal cleavage/methylation domain-containing protein
MKGFERKDSIRGFTLLELAIVMIIIAVLIVPLIKGYEIYMERQKREVTAKNIATVQEALAWFVVSPIDPVNAPNGAKNRRLPCPAERAAPMDTAAFGAEGTCTAIPGSIAVVPGAAVPPGQVVIGAVPFRALNIPSEATFDGWGRRLTYAVTLRLTSETTRVVDVNTPIFGDIALVDSTGVSKIKPDGTGAYALISHGENGLGAYSADGGVVGHSCTGNTHEVENCNDDARFTSVSYTAKEDATYYDDTALVMMSLKTVEDGIPVCAAGQTLVSNGTTYMCQNPPAAAPMPLTCPAGQTLSFNGTSYVCQNVVDTPVFLSYQKRGGASGPWGNVGEYEVIAAWAASVHDTHPACGNSYGVSYQYYCPPNYRLIYYSGTPPVSSNFDEGYIGCLLDGKANPYPGTSIVGQTAVESFSINTAACSAHGP